MILYILQLLLRTVYCKLSNLLQIAKIKARSSFITLLNLLGNRWYNPIEQNKGALANVKNINFLKKNS
ncbi:hypothetical protein MA5_01455 [Rickettsia prowazekii str. GvV257]|uniref:Uncharacterized protein n=1 Tax=Rickettsia prowazekii (strain Rp22) TaxID=449216 RepID=D5AVU0_RICPP|nr:hypothetical protein rpr22_0019 [Rickettsia prowazekii str. Rp22]AFE48850.1 hypothetical protein M9W_00085 [Rickettsia prowazekii str. Chernikova]AFE49695.1 hypothetical protein M9Y_00085 [Rickettsia prowazekii str. Katsinyian]AFE50539.1 hypothetical protein MA1_00085 [Rickettsia prowazekii str. BuV67-CWPP]AFE51382.1 hypothetical protein MA3_00085 [Rickettsia prowazekii str. Dachau]AFE52477.1 hypothetical protein MA5_01455 [Rickettsia prowazekii str. GvV257]AFE53047.1 hypothetical protein 